MPVSYISNKEIKKSESVKGMDIREGIFKLIKTDFRGFSDESIISIDELNKYRRLYLTKLVEQERGELALTTVMLCKQLKTIPSYRRTLNRK